MFNNYCIDQEVERFYFSSLRSDWYSANSAVPKAFRRHLSGKKNLCFSGFHRQWIPIFFWFDVPWENSISPPQYIPFFSDLSEQELVRIVLRALNEKSLRNLVESASMYDPIISDFLYILDNTTPILSRVMEREIQEITRTPENENLKIIKLTGWQSYGRPSVRMFEQEIYKVEPISKVAAALPCSLTRPYDKSRVHKKIYKKLTQQGYDLNNIHRVVITSLGVIPQELWEMPQVLVYDAGVPDIYRILRIARKFFKKANFECVIDNLQFEPYSDILRIVHREGLIGRIEKIDVRKSERYYIR